MRLLVFSESHGAARPMLRLIEAESPDGVIFLGDVVKDIEAVRGSFPALPFYIVPGNCDHTPVPYPDSLLLELDGVRIFAAHGHNHGVKYGLDAFCNSVWCSGSALGLFGHTHRPEWQSIRGMQIMNPGSIGNRLSPTYGLITIENNAVQCKIMDYCAENDR